MSALSNWVQGIDLDKIIEWGLVAVAALISLSVHESCHGLAARWLGDDTAKRMGRISLNPLRHFELVGFLMMVFFRFGWAKPVPVNPSRMTKIKSPKLGMALTAAAGPVSNLLLALLFCLGFLVTYYAGGRELWMMWGGYAEASGWRYYLSLLLNIGMVLNVGLAVFNLLPISPLDGSKILAIVLPERAYGTLMRYERYGMLVLLVLVYTGLLDSPLSLLRNAVLDGMVAIVQPLARLLTGA